MIFPIFVLLCCVFSFHDLERSSKPFGRTHIVVFRTKLQLRNRNIRNRLLKRLREFEYDVIGYNEDDDALKFLTNEEEIATLKRSGFQELSTMKFPVVDYDLLNPPTHPKRSVLKKQRSGMEFPIWDYNLLNPPDNYSKVESINDHMITLKSQNPSKVQTFNILDQGGRRGEGGIPRETWEGRPILGLKIQNVISEENEKPNILIVGNHHAREIVTPEMVIGCIEHILEERPEILELYNFVAIPILNVDGYNYVFTKNRFWKKNMRRFDVADTNDDGDECMGVDLDRNYDVGFGGGCHSTNDECGDSYQGPKAFSEPETMGIRNLIKDMKFAKILDFHSSGRNVLWGYPEEYSDGEIGKYHLSIAKGLSDQSGGKYGTRHSNEGHGEQQEYQMKKSTLFSFLVEPSKDIQPEYSVALDEVEFVLPIFDFFLDFPIPITGVVSDRESGKGIADVKLDVVKKNGGYFDFSEFDRKTDKRGLYHLFLADGEYSVSFMKKGYVKEEISVVLERGKSLKKSVTLSKRRLSNERKRRRRRRRKKRKF